jgi:hypothetical protein
VPSYTEYLAWPAATRRQWTHVLATIADHPALAPEAQRTRVPTGSDPKTYVFLASATTATGAAAEPSTVLLAYNLQPEPATLHLDLGTTDLPTLATTDQPRPTRDLLTGEPGPTIAADSLDVELPGYGSAFLEIQPPP